MLNLIKNEYLKIFKKKSNLIATIFFLIIFLGGLYLASRDYDDYDYMYTSTDSSDYMSKEWIQSELSNYENADSYDEYYYYLSVIDSLGLYGRENELYTIIDTTAIDLLPDDTVMDDSQKESALAILTDAIKALSDGNSTEFLTIMSNAVPAQTYSFEDSNEIITNLYQYCLDNAIDPMNDYTAFGYLFNTIQLQDKIEQLYTNGGSSSTQYKMYYNGLLLQRYRIDHPEDNTIIDATLSNSSSTDATLLGDSSSSTTSSDFWSTLTTSASMLTLAGILVLIFAGSSVAGEFSNGTIKFLLINPVKRSKIIISKYLTILSLSVIFTGAFFIISILFSGIVNGFSDITGQYITISDGSITHYNGLLYIAKLYLFTFIDNLCYATMAFALSSLFRNASLAIGFSVAFLFSGSIVTIMLEAFHQDWGRFLIFSNSDLTSITSGSSTFPNQTTGFAVAIIVIHMVVFLLTAYDGFTRREV